MKKAVTAIIAILVIGGALYLFYGQMKKLGYFQPAPPPIPAGGIPAEMMPGGEMPGTGEAAPTEDTAPAEGSETEESAPAEEATE